MRQEGAPPANGPAQPPAPRPVWFAPGLVPHRWRWISVLPLLLLAPVGVAAVPVEESVAEGPNPGDAPAVAERPMPPPDAAQPPPSAPDGQAGEVSLGAIFHRIQVLQGEVQDLRGMVEEQGFQIERLARDQKEQYIDLDQRILALRNDGADAARPGAASAGGSAPTAPPSPQTAPAAGSQGGPERERQDYAAAFNHMKSRAFAEAITAFKQMIANYPNGQYAANGYYWLGEIFLVEGKVEDARQHFAQVVSLYPDHSKTPDALYKLGVVYHRLDDVQQALAHLDRVQKEHPNSSAANLARSYAAELDEAP